MAAKIELIPAKKAYPKCPYCNEELKGIAFRPLSVEYHEPDLLGIFSISKSAMVFLCPGCKKLLGVVVQGAGTN